jgi:hypothetical protein
MATKKSVWIFIGFFVITALLLGFVIEAQAETMKCRVARVVTKDEITPISDEEGHVFGMQISEGLAFFENGDIADFKSQSFSDRARGTRQAISYIFFTFEDGSSIIAKLDFRAVTDPSGNISTNARSLSKNLLCTSRLRECVWPCLRQVRSSTPCCC